MTPLAVLVLQAAVALVVLGFLGLALLLVVAAWESDR